MQGPILAVRKYHQTKKRTVAVRVVEITPLMRLQRTQSQSEQQSSDEESPQEDVPIKTTHSRIPSKPKAQDNGSDTENEAIPIRRSTRARKAPARLIADV